MTIRSLQEELEKERAILKAAKDRIAIQNKELEELRKASSSGNGPDSALADANTRLTELINNLQNGVFVVDENRNVVIINELFCRLFNIDAQPGSLIGTHGPAITNDIKHLFDDPQKFVSTTEEFFKNKQTVLNHELKMRSGQIFSLDYIPFFSEGNYRGHLWKYTDITRNKTIGDTFETQRKFYEQILNNIPSDVAVFDSDHRYLYVNPKALSNPEHRKWVIGKTNEEFFKHTNSSIELAEVRNKVFNEIKRTKKQHEWEESFVMPDGTSRYHLRRMFPVIDEKGEVEIVIGYGVDITERKRIEEQILQSEKRYREIFSFSQAWICSHDLQGKLLSLNPAACKILGYEEKKIIGRTIISFIPEKFQPEFADSYIGKIMADGKAEGILNIINKEGKNVYLLYQNYLVNEKGEEPYVIGFAQDISERLYAEEALKRSEEKYKGIIENMNLGMIELDSDEHIIYANQRFCAMSGYEPAELIGKTATDLFLRGTSLKRTRTQLAKNNYGIDTNYELTVKTKSGEDKWWLTSATPLYSADEKVKGTISIHLDITDQKKMEDQLKVAKLVADRSSKSKDIFLTNMSHEIRTPLNAIMGLGKLLSKSDLNGQQKSYLNGIESASVNLLGIINDLLDFSKIEAGKITLEHISFNLGTICSQVITILGHKAEEKGLILTHEIDERIAPVLIGDPFRINQIFMNMVSNAIKFTEKGSVYLKAFLIDTSDGWQKILVVVEDTGVGIKEEYLDSIFDKFTQEDETVVRKFGGTGLGMSITKQLMELMGGTITVNSKKNVGTTISLTFRFKIGTSRVLEKKKTIKNDTGIISGKRILLVEDNNLNRLLAYTILTDYGAVVLEAENGLQATEIMKTEDFDLVLMDIQMPVMDGMQATRIIRKEINKSVPILALTANAIKGKENLFLDAGMNDFIFKPYNEINLVNPISKWLGKTEHDIVTSPEIGEHIAEVEAAPVADEKLYDLSKLLAIGRNDPNFIKKMLGLFVTETPPGVEKLVEGYMSGDLETVRYFAHRMKPSITNLGILGLKDDILKIEFIKEKGPEMEQLVEKLQNTINRVVDQIRVEYQL